MPSDIDGQHLGERAGANESNALQRDQSVAGYIAKFWISTRFRIRISPCVMLSEAKHL